MTRPTLCAIEADSGHHQISIVLPTYNRAAALRENLAGFLAVKGIKEIVVVDDGSIDDTAAVLAAHDDSRLRVVALERNGGQPNARNTGVAAASGEWILFAEDDCRFPPDYALVLAREASAHGADIVGAPFIYPRDEPDLPAAMGRGRARPVRRVGMDSVKRFPPGPTRTPFMPATALVRRKVFDVVRFDQRYGGNAWREETAFFVEAARRGFACLLTDATAAYQLDHYEGGARVPRLSYEYWTLRNNWRFLRRHGAWLAEQGYLRSPSIAQLELLGLRVRSLASGWVSTHLRRVAARTRDVKGARAVSGRAAIVTSAGGGGVERFSSLLARALEARGWEVELVSTRREPARWVVRLGGGPLRTGRWLSEAVEHVDPDIVVTNGELGALHRLRPRIHVYHGTMVGHTLADVGTPLRQRARALLGDGLAEALSARGATRVAVSEGAAREVERCFRARVDAVIPNGVDVELFRPRDRTQARVTLDLDAHKRYALYVGRIEGRKGGDLLEPAARGGGFELLVAGSAAPPSARHLGTLSPERLALAYAAADVVLFPTRYEGCSFVVLEALACGTPLVTTAAGWMPEFLRALPDYRRLVVAPDVEDVAARLRTLDLADLDGLTGAARDWIVANNSLAVFDRAWGELVDRVAGRVPREPVRAPEATAA